MASKREAPIAVVAATETKVAKEKGPLPGHPRPRIGKTQRDRANNAKSKNQQNKDMRASWQNDSKRTAFPTSSCNGKRNRYQYTGEGNTTVYVGMKKP